MIVVSDSSIITGLLAIDKLAILNQLFGQVLLTESVSDELKSLAQFGYDLTKLQKDWIHTKAIVDSRLSKILQKRLDLGEADSIVLSIEEKADYLLIDEKKGRRIAKEFGINVLGLLGILIQAKKEGLIPSLKPEIDILTSKLEFRLSPTLIDKALEIVGEK